MSASPAVRPSYAVVLRVPHARRTFAAALTGRLSYGIVPLSLMLAVTRSSGSYAVAGTVMALFGATTVFLSPARAALIDRHGPRRALVPMTAAYLAVLVLLTLALARPAGAPAPVLGALAATAGACVPPLGPTMRAVWGRLTPDRALLQRAYSLDGVAEELLFVTGPLLVGVLVGFAPPAAGILVGAALMAGGTAGFLSSPAVRAVGPGKATVRRAAAVCAGSGGRWPPSRAWGWRWAWSICWSWRSPSATGTGPAGRAPPGCWPRCRPAAPSAGCSTGPSPGGLRPGRGCRCSRRGSG